MSTATCSAHMIGQVLHILPPTSAAVLDRYLRAQLGRFRSPALNRGFVLFDKICAFVDVYQLLPQGRRYAAHAYMHLLACGAVGRFDQEIVGALDRALRDLFVDSRNMCAENASQLDHFFLDLPTGVREIRAACGSTMVIPGELNWGARHEVPEGMASTQEGLFERIRQKACLEVRMKIVFTIGTVLAAELTELIVEAALVCEGLLSEESVWAVEEPPGCLEEMDSQ